MSTSIDAFYAVYLTGAAGPSLAMLALRKHKVIGTDLTGVKIFGSYEAIDGGAHRVSVTVGVAPNTYLLQGVNSGPEDGYDVVFDLPEDFLARDFIRLETKYGPINARFVRLGDLDD